MTASAQNQKLFPKPLHRFDTAFVNIKTISEFTPQQWDRYVSAHPQGGVFHTSAMHHALAETPKHQPTSMVAVDQDDEIVAMLSSTRIETVTGLASSFASRCVWYAEPICDSTEVGRDGLRRLIDEHERRVGSRIVFSEVRPLFAPGHEKSILQSCGYEYKDYLNYLVHTSSDVDTLWSALRKSARKKIRQSEKRGVEIRIDNTHAGVDRMYDLVAQTYARSKVPLASRQLFHAALDHFDSAVVQIRLASHEGKDVAGGIGLVFGDRFFAWYGGSLRLQGILPFDCLTWDEIKWASENHVAIYDFGGAGWPEEDYGPREFKAKFGGELTHFGRYQKIHSQWKYVVAERGYRVLRGFISSKSVN